MLRKIFILLIISISIIAQESKFPIPQIEFNPKNYVCYRTDQPINIDGDIYDLQWINAPWTDLFVDIEGSVKPNPYYQTRARMLWDDVYFYIAAELKEDHIWGKLNRRDDVIYYDNDFEVFIDPDNDTHNYYELEINALNTVWDLLLIKPYRDGDKVAVTDWDIKGLKTAVKIYGTLNDPTDIDSSWTAEIAIPWTTFRELSNSNLPPKENDQWRVNFSRVQWETEIDNNIYVKAKNPETNKYLNENNWVWSPQGIIAMHYPEMWGYIQFSCKLLNHGHDSFILDPDENIKWLLREIYYKEKTYFMTHKSFTSNLLLLGYTEKELIIMKLNPIIQSTSESFNASLKTDSKVFTIYEDGKLTTKIIQ